MDFAAVIGVGFWIFLTGVAVTAVLVGRRVANSMFTGMVAGAIVGAIGVTLAAYIEIAASHDLERHGDSDWLIPLIGPIVGGIPGAMLGLAVGALRSGYRKVAGWIAAVPFTGFVVFILSSASQARVSEVITFALLPMVIAGWGWYLLLTGSTQAASDREIVSRVDRSNR